MSAQHGEDLWLAAKLGGVVHGYAVDVGASDGISINNTYGLEVRGWDVLCVEPSPIFHHSLAFHRKMVSPCAAGAVEERKEFIIYGPVGGFAAGSSLNPSEKLIGTVEGLKEFGRLEVDVYRLDRLLEEAKFPRCDVVSIDTEGTEADVLRGFDPRRWQTRIAIIENNFEDDETRKIMRDYGFTMVDRLGVNDLWEVS